MNYTLCLLETITQSEQNVKGEHGFDAVAVEVAVVAEENTIPTFCVIIKRKTTFETKHELIVSKAYIGRKCKAYFDVVQFVIVAAAQVFPPALRQRNVWS